jgi:tol-pal system protein YbgF
VIRLRQGAVLTLALVALGGCATKGDLRRVEEQVLLSRGENQRADSARAAQLAEVIEFQRTIMDSVSAASRGLTEVQRQVSVLRGDLSNELINVQQQLVQVQALTGQSQQRLTELQTQIEARSEQVNAAIAPGDTSGAAPPGASSAEQIYQTSMQQLRRGSPGTARVGFREFLRLYPGHALVPDAVYFLGETFASESPDSAAVYYRRVAESYPKSPRAAGALYKLGLLAERRKELEPARGYYQRVVRDHPASNEAALARDRLKSIGR